MYGITHTLFDRGVYIYIYDIYSKSTKYFGPSAIKSSMLLYINTHIHMNTVNT